MRFVRKENCHDDVNVLFSVNIYNRGQFDIEGSPFAMWLCSSGDLIAPFSIICAHTVRTVHVLAESCSLNCSNGGTCSKDAKEVEKCICASGWDGPTCTVGMFC